MNRISISQGAFSRMLRRLSALFYNPETKQFTRVSQIRYFNFSFFLLTLPLILFHSIEFAHDLAVDLHSNTLFGLQFGFGELVGSLYSTGIYTTYHHDGVWAIASRMPVIPLFLFPLVKLSPFLLPALIVKNLIFWSFWTFAILRLAKDCDSPALFVLLGFLVSMLIPFNLYVGLNLQYEEGFLYQLMGLMFAYGYVKKSRIEYLFLGIVLFLVYLTKSSMLPLCAFVGLWVLLQALVRKRDLAVRWVPLFFLAGAALWWGAFTLEATGHFAFGATTSSWNGVNYYKGNNEFVSRLYPETSLDMLDVLGYLAVDKHNFVVRNEWEINQYYMAKANAFIRNHPREALRNDLTKFYVALIGWNHAFPGEAETGRYVFPSMIANRLLLWTTFLLCFWMLWNKKARVRDISLALLTLGMIATYILPYIVGFAYFRHMVPIFGLSILFLFTYVSRAFAETPRDTLQMAAADCRYQLTARP